MSATYSQMVQQRIIITPPILWREKSNRGRFLIDSLGEGYFTKLFF